MKSTLLLRCILMVLLVSLSSCLPPQSQAGNYLQRTAGLAKDHIMLIRQEPATFGLARMNALAAYYPDLETFLELKGQPNFLAETAKGENSYILLYYLDSRQTFACRASGMPAKTIEFSGPYPITDGEAKTLRNLRDRPDPSPLRDRP